MCVCVCVYIYIYRRDILLGILLLEPCISLIYACKANKYTNYSFSLLIMYGNSYMFRHYIAIFRERSCCLLRDPQLRLERTTSLDTTRPSTIFYRLLLNCAS